MARIFVILVLTCIISGIGLFTYNGNKDPRAYILPEKGALITPESLDAIKISQPVEEKNESDEEKIKDMIENFTSQRVMASETMDFSLVMQYILKDSNFFRFQELLVGYLYSAKINQKFLGIEINEISFVDDLEKPFYRVKVKERLDIKHPNSDYIINNFYWKYKVIFVDGRPLIFDIQEGSSNINTYESQIPEVEPSKYKENKFAMVDSAMKALQEYFEVDFESTDFGILTLGCEHTYGNGLLKTLMSSDKRKDEIIAQKLRRKILMSEIKRISVERENGTIEAALRIETTQNNIKTVSDINVLVNMKFMGFRSWYVSNIENCPFP